MEKKFSKRNVALRREVETRFFSIDRRYPRTRYRSSRTFYIAQPWPVSHWTVVAPFSARTRSRGSVRRHQIPIRYALHFRGNYVFITAIGSVETNGSLWTGWSPGSGRMVENDIASRCSDTGTGSEKMIRNEVARDGIHPLLYICADERFRNDPLGACR